MLDLEKLNTMTKYPSIPTYHALGEKGCLVEEPVAFPEDDEILLTEKVDGTNTRLIFTDDHTIIGSRNELLWAVGDLIRNPTQQIVETLESLAYSIRGHMPRYATGSVFVVYGEVFGSKVGKAAKNYGKTTSYRIFDIARIDGAQELMEGKTIEELSSHRDRDLDRWLPEDKLREICEALWVPLTPRLTPEKQFKLPMTVDEMNDFLQQFSATQCSIDPTAKGKSEGLVIRTASRNVIAKVRFEDYQRTLRKRAQK